MSVSAHMEFKHYPDDHESNEWESYELISAI